MQVINKFAEKQDKTTNSENKTSSDEETDDEGNDINELNVDESLDEVDKQLG